MTNKMRVLLVDDHAVVRTGYRMLLESEPDIVVCAEADSGETACRSFADLSPDLVIMDLSLPGMGGLEAIRRIRARDPRAGVLVFSMHEDDVFVQQALEAGAKGYIPKSSAPRTLVEAARAIARGRVYIEGEIASRLAMQKTQGTGPATPFAGLSTREFEIFCLLAEGLSSNEVASRLSLSYKTVANYSTQIKAKLEVGTVAEMTRLAIRHGVVQP